MVTTFNTLLDVVNFNQNDRVLHVAPLTHASGNLFLPSFIRGGANVPLQRFDPALFCRTVEEEGITTVFLAPTMVIRLLAFSDLGRYDLKTLHTIISGGDPMPLEPLREALKRFGPGWFKSTAWLRPRGLTRFSPGRTMASAGKTGWVRSAGSYGTSAFASWMRGETKFRRERWAS